MSGFLSGKRMMSVDDRAQVKRKKAWLALGVATVSMLIVCFVATFYGSKKGRLPVGDGMGDSGVVVLEQVHTNRAYDVAYMQELADNRAEQVQLAGARSRVVEAMEKMIEEVRAALPPDADADAIKAELEKRPEWKAMEAANARMVESIETTLASARETVRLRMERELSDQKKVAEGRAVPIPVRQ
jgi:hypothetical protein